MPSTLGVVASHRTVAVAVLDPEAFLYGQVGHATTPDTPDLILPNPGSVTAVLRYQADSFPPFTGDLWPVGGASPGWHYGPSGGYRVGWFAGPTSQKIAGNVMYGGNQVTPGLPFTWPTGAPKQWIALTIRNQYMMKFITRTSVNGFNWTVVNEFDWETGGFTANWDVPLTVGHSFDHMQNTPFTGRIHMMECRTGEDPAGGTVLWRMNPDEWTGGTTWADPRGRTWTLSAAGAIQGVPRSGLVGWWDADDASTFTYSSGSSVSEWRDKSGQGRHLRQSVVASQPQRTGTYNGRPTVIFDGVDDFLDTSALTVTGPLTVCLALSPVNDTNQNWFSISDQLTCFIHGGYNAVTLIRTGYMFPGDSGFAAPIAYEVFYNGASSEMYRSGTRMATGTVGTGAVTGPFRLSAAAEGINGPVMEMVVYDRVLTEPERSKVHAYMKSKWNIS